MGVALYFLMSFFVVMLGFVVLGVTFYSWKKNGIPKAEEK